MLLRTLYLSLDPHMRGRMSDGPSYAAPVAVGDVMVGGTVSRVQASRHNDFKVGDLVLGYVGWQDDALSDGKGLTPLLDEEPHPSRALGVLGMPGFTAYVGLLDIGAPVAGETVVVAAASGAVGSVVGQIAKLKGCTRLHTSNIVIVADDAVVGRHERLSDAGQTRDGLRRSFLALDHFLEEGLGGSNVSPRAQPEVHHLTGSIHSPVQVDPAAAKLHIGLVDSP
jgi:hypothetical protein